MHDPNDIQRATFPPSDPSLIPSSLPEPDGVARPTVESGGAPSPTAPVITTQRAGDFMPSEVTASSEPVPTAAPPVMPGPPPHHAAPDSPPPLLTPLPVATAPVTPQPTVSSSNALNPVLAMLLGGVLACVLVGLGMLLQARRVPAGSTSSGTLGGPFSGISNAGSEHIVAAVRRVGPAVMNVDTSFGQGNTNSEFLPDPGLGPAPREGKGTGVVYDSKKGLMLTNAHVIAPQGQPAKRIQVTTREGKKYTGRLVGFDRFSDIAVVELSNKNLPAATLANFQDTRKLDIGQWVIAIGNPFAQANTVTVGVLSAVGRNIPVPGGRNGKPFSLTDMVQTDAAINPGNSGGPLCNVDGEVIGINTAIIPFGTGLGFAIPINKAKEVADRLVANGGKVPYVGVLVQPITEELRKEYGLPDRKGALITGITPGSPAAQAGVMQGDVIRTIDGQEMKSAQEVVDTLRKKKIGRIIPVEVLRNNTVKKTLRLKVAAQPLGVE